MNSTPRVAAGTVVPGVSLRFRAERVLPRAYFASAMTATRAATLMTSETPRKPSALTMLTIRAATASPATTVATTRRCPTW